MTTEELHRMVTALESIAGVMEWHKEMVIADRERWEQQRAKIDAEMGLAEQLREVMPPEPDPMKDAIQAITRMAKKIAPPDD
jgi:hypothetical protein